MRIFNQLKSIELTESDCNLKLGELVTDTLETFIPEQKKQEEIKTYKVLREYENGGKDVEEIIEQPFLEYIPPHSKFEDILVYIPYTAEQLLEKQTKEDEERAINEKQELIADLKQELSKLKEDVEQVDLFGMTRTDYEEKKARCREIITELRTLESQIS